MAVAWKSTLNKALDANKHLKYSTFFQLATVRPDGKPSNRTVVFRGFLDDSTKITFTTDTRCENPLIRRSIAWRQVMGDFQ